MSLYKISMLINSVYLFFLLIFCYLWIMFAVHFLIHYLPFYIHLLTVKYNVDVFSHSVDYLLILFVVSF